MYEVRGSRISSTRDPGLTFGKPSTRRCKVQAAKDRAREANESDAERRKENADKEATREGFDRA